jgi:hypothetical protein
LLRVLLLGRTMMRRAMLLSVLIVLPLWARVASTLLTLRARSLRTYVRCRILLAIRTVVARPLLWGALVLRRALRLLWVVATIWLMRIVRSVIICTTLIATASAPKSTTTALRLLILRLLLRVSVLLLLLVWWIAGRRWWRRRVVVLLGASHRASNTVLQVRLVVRAMIRVARVALLMKGVAFR